MLILVIDQMLISNVEIDARSSHYFSFFFSFVSKRSIEFFSFYRWMFHEISLTCWMTFKRAIVETKKIIKNAKTVKKISVVSTIISKQLKILLKILLKNLYAFEFQIFSLFCIFRFFQHFVIFHSSIKSNNSFWKWFWHDSVLHAS